jgi:predicted HTH domain antitoxin
VGGPGDRGEGPKRRYADLENAIAAFKRGQLDAETAARRAGMAYRAFLEELKHRGFRMPPEPRPPRP